jgi:hypothetical protein
MKTNVKNLIIALALIAGIHQASAGLEYIGNSLSVENGGPDGLAPLVILGEYVPLGPASESPIIFPAAGKVTAVDFYGEDYDFTLYALRHVGEGIHADTQMFEVVAAHHFSGRVSQARVVSLGISNFKVQEGDFLAFAGIGPWYPQWVGDDALYSDATYENSSSPDSYVATAPGGPGTVFSVGTHADRQAKYDYISNYYDNQGRDYGIGVEFESQP